ncbi:hypothetical protein [Tritonibacter scottomollicae]|uniref:Uncharacterized protein n=1 Tax=Tritonibacter scottomollicae TaxID=483013 RepID=A0A2T1AJR4_TRISK|nr:hypothetical protein [Tritonibacter scottomollicae]PRZ48803.1 hypothetical protein CLV89_103114 [Tritonibacter scottomollicae]
MAPRWHISRAEGELTLSRQLPARFDVVATTTLPVGDPMRLAHQIRQDMWRALQRVRGFSPVVRLTRQGEVIRVEAGGRVAAPVAPGLAAEIGAVLACPARRARWVAQAQRSGRTL